MNARGRPVSHPLHGRGGASSGPTHPTGRAAALMVAVTVAIVVLALVAAAGGR